MPAPHCYTSVQLCALRAFRLDSDGSPLAGAENRYETTALLQLGISWELAAGDNFELKNGCGKVCTSVTQPDRVKSAGLALELCHLDAELIEMLTGGSLISVGGVTRGFEPPSPDDDPPNVGLETWTKAWDGEEQALDGTDPLYYRFAWPKSTWVAGNFTLQNEILRVPVTGKCTRNTGFGDGPLNDWPSVVAQPGSWFLDTELPAGQCGYMALAGS